MGDPVKPASGPAVSEESLRFGFSATAGGGFALRNDGDQTAVGPRIEVSLGPRIDYGRDRFYVGLVADFIRLNQPLFGRAESDWVQTYGARVGYGRELIPSWLTLSTHLDMGLSVYGDAHREDIQNGIYLREYAAAGQIALGLGVCFWKERFCPMVDYTHGFRSYLSKQSDLNSDTPNLVTRTHDTNGINASLLVDIGKFF